MPTPALSEALAREAVERVEAKLREGFRPEGMTGVGPGAIAAASAEGMRSGWCSSKDGFRGRLRIAKDKFGIEPDWSLYRPARYHQPAPVAVLQPAPPPEPELTVPDGPAERVMVIGDLHQDPRHEHRLEVLSMLARMASDKRPDRIVQIGDWSTWDSCSTHDRNETTAARLKPGIRADMDNLQASLAAWRAGIAADYKPRQTVVLGNHENRVERFENANPETVGTYTLARDESFAQFGWKVRPYGEIVYIQGVGFTHHPVNGAGRAFGGKTGPQRAANETVVPIVSGHTHRRQIHDAPKIGPIGVISMVEVGCAMPWGEVEGYAAHSLTGWWWGVCELTVQGGQILDVGFTSMLTVRDRYG